MFAYSSPVHTFFVFHMFYFRIESIRTKFWTLRKFVAIWYVVEMDEVAVLSTLFSIVGKEESRNDITVSV